MLGRCIFVILQIAVVFAQQPPVPQQPLQPAVPALGGDAGNDGNGNPNVDGSQLPQDNSDGSQPNQSPPFQNGGAPPPNVLGNGPPDNVGQFGFIFPNQGPSPLAIPPLQPPGSPDNASAQGQPIPQQPIQGQRPPVGQFGGFQFGQGPFDAGQQFGQQPQAQQQPSPPLPFQPQPGQSPLIAPPLRPAADLDGGLPERPPPQRNFVQPPFGNQQQPQQVRNLGLQQGGVGSRPNFGPPGTNSGDTNGQNGLPPPLFRGSGGNTQFQPSQQQPQVPPRSLAPIDGSGNNTEVRSGLQANIQPQRISSRKRL